MVVVVKLSKNEPATRKRTWRSELQECLKKADAGDYYEGGEVERWEAGVMGFKLGRGGRSGVW